MPIEPELTTELARIRDLNQKLRSQLNADGQALYDRLEAHTIKRFPQTYNHPLEEIVELLSIAHCFLAYKEIHKIITSQPEHVGRDRPLRVGDAGCGYAYLVPVIDMICEELGLTYTYDGFDIDKAFLQEMPRRYKPELDANKHIRIHKLNFSKTKLIEKLEGCGIDTTLGLDLWLIQHPNVGSKMIPNKAAFLRMLNEAPHFTNPTSYCHVSTYANHELHILLEEGCKRSLKYARHTPYELFADEKMPHYREPTMGLIIPMELSLRDYYIASMGNETYDAGMSELSFRAHRYSYPYVTSEVGEVPYTPSSYQATLPLVGCACCDIAEIDKKSTPEILHAVAKQLFENKHFQDAFCAYQLILKHPLEKPGHQLHHDIYRCALKIRDFDTANAHLELARKQSKAEQGLYYKACSLELIALKLFHENKFQSALTVLGDALNAFKAADQVDKRSAELTVSVTICKIKILEHSAQRLMPAKQALAESEIEEKSSPVAGAK